MKTLFYFYYPFSKKYILYFTLLSSLTFTWSTVLSQNGSDDDIDYGWHYSAGDTIQEVIRHSNITRLTMLRYETFATVFFHVDLWSSSANARILSAYGLVGSLQRSDPDQVGEICCRTGHGVYSIATVPTDPEENIATIPPIGELQDFVEFSFLTQGIDLIDDISNINGEFGYRGGGVRKDCLLEIVSGRSNDDSKPQTSESILKSPAELKQNGNTIWLNRDNSDSSPWHFSVYDLSGRLITEKDGNDTEAELIDLENESWPNGIYLGVLRSDKQIIPIKIIHSY
ncbi:MAG: T9SS type A sorting domain-containing protein [bacterium]|nr:T9SS type A sorting domain-containing protein [bacterium]